MSGEHKVSQKRGTPQRPASVGRRPRLGPSRTELETIPMSTALIDIARPLFDALSPDAPLADYQRTLVTARLAWNFAVAQELGRPMDPSKLLELDGVSNEHGGRELLVDLAARKRVLYPRDRRLVMAATLSRSGSDFELATASVAALETFSQSATRPAVANREARAKAGGRERENRSVRSERGERAAAGRSASPE